MCLQQNECIFCYLSCTKALDNNVHMHFSPILPDLYLVHANGVMYNLVRCAFCSFRKKLGEYIKCFLRMMKILMGGILDMG